MSKKLIFYIAGFLCSIHVAAQAPIHRHLVQGDRFYDRKAFDKAEAAYRQAGGATGAYNAGVAALRQGKHEAAMSLLETAARSGDPLARAAAWYNRGNAALLMGQYEEAISAYEKSLRLQPNQADAKKNLQIAKRKQQTPPNQTPPPPPPPPPPMAAAQTTFVDQARQPLKKETLPPDMPAETAIRLLEQAIAPRESEYARQYREGVRGLRPSGKKKNW